jgi:hypothetical protein
MGRKSASPFRNLIRRATTLSAACWIGLAVLAVVVLATAHPQNPESAIGAALIICASWLPLLIWARKRMGGLPIFPIFAITHTWTFGLPLLYEHPIVRLFESTSQLYAASSVTGFLLLAAVVWYWARTKRSYPRRYCLAMNEQQADALFLFIVGASIIFTVAVNGGWFNVSTAVFGIVRSIILAIEALACFALSHRLGAGNLTGLKATLFKLLLVILVIVSLAPLLMVTSMAIVALSAFGYVSGGGRVPWISFAISVLVFAFLHIGKAEMRDRYWGEAEQGAVAPTAYPKFFLEWLLASWDELGAPEKEEKTSLLERASLMQLLLYEQTLSNTVPFMDGETYVIVPQLMIPRILYPNRPTTHEGTYRLNIHYGFQTKEQTETTTLGFGLLNEAYANFGLVGMALLAIVLGLYYGTVEHWAVSSPLLSARGLFAIVVASFSFQTEFAAGVYAAALFQSLIALFLLCVFIMRLRPNPLALRRA